MEFYLKLIFIQLYASGKDTPCYISLLFHAFPFILIFFHGIATYILYHAQPKKKTPQFPTS
ncbi:hypothetical protein FAEPRAA2165_01622 [Faecalibacterium duncaniae]|uniref:Uncharacterized protein n=1 Tax=Faecalibacterium duncaniae (strain DSM 17677 / JCM 31915 / A2-165) TaxID=411483 RepID=C7H5P9_FAED2|nr:hypothetical protein FAEPRAA2165_01622 [Faecalibacterium duncaniae]